MVLNSTALPPKAGQTPGRVHSGKEAPNGNFRMNAVRLIKILENNKLRNHKGGELRSTCLSASTIILATSFIL